MLPSSFLADLDAQLKGFTNRKISSSVFLQQLLFFNVHYSIAWFVFFSSHIFRKCVLRAHTTSRAADSPPAARGARCGWNESAAAAAAAHSRAAARSQPSPTAPSALQTMLRYPFFSSA
jgi:hypothetical protein